MNRRVAFVGLLCLFGGQVLFAGSAGAKKQFIYSVKEARAYAAKSSLHKEVVNAAPKCKPEEDKQYACTDHNHKPNCPKKIEIGERGKVPMPSPPKGVEPDSGRAGEGVGEDPPPQSSPIRLNRLASLAKQSHLFGVREAGGLASSIYTDSSGRSEPEAHTVSEGFSNTVRDWEERCYWHDGGRDTDSYEHFLSRSGRAPDTYHLAECVGRQCQFAFGINAERSRQIVHIVERKGKVVGSIESMVEGMQFGGPGGIVVDSVVTYVSFESDGTEPGLKWAVASRASDARLGGQPVPLPPGETVSGGGFSVGMAEPYVEAAPDGTTLTMIAPGLHVGHQEQAALFGGAELYMSAGQQAQADLDFDDGLETEGGGVFDDDGSFNSGLGSGGISGGTSGFDGGVTGGEDGGDTLAAGETGEVMIFEKATGIGAVAVIVALGGFCWFLLLSRWLQRYTWGQKLSRMQPFKFIDWMYRAFIKT